MYRQHIGWKFGIVAGLAVVVITLIPQIIVCIDRGRDWQGSYAFTDPDELAYSAYLNSIIEGRPRRNNPYLGTKESPATAAGENFYSIQFLPSYGLALLAQLSGLSASTVFILLVPVMAFASSMTVFWLISDVTGDDKLAALGTMIILLSGVMVSESPFVSENAYGGFPFLRRYIPAVSFPVFFMFCVFVWRGFTSQARSAFLWSLAAGVSFGVLVYSYFYLWSAAAAWFLCLAALWAIARPAERARVVMCIASFGAVAVIASVPYFYMLAHRTETMDRAQGLLLTHAPDLFRFIEIIGVLILVALAWQARRGIVDWRSPVVLFAASCAVVPFVVFNQQVISGRSLQSFHYEQFIINYQVLVGLVITYKLIWWRLPIRSALWIALAVIVGVATGLTTSAANAGANRLRDESMPVFARIQEGANRDRSSGAVLFEHPLLATSAPTNCSLAVLWSSHMYTFESTNTSENVERFYQYLYFMGVDAHGFEAMLTEQALARAAVFGLHRVNSKLTLRFNPVSSEEIRLQVQSYSAYIAGFSRERARQWPLSYVILIAGNSHNLSNLDRWYERHGDERIGRSVLYGVRPRPEEKTVTRTEPDVSAQ